VSYPAIFAWSKCAARSLLSQYAEVWQALVAGANGVMPPLVAITQMEAVAQFVEMMV